MTFPILGGNSVTAGYSIDNSLRFNDGDNPNLNRTFSSSGSRTTWTFSTWVKKCEIADTQFLFGVNSSSNPENNGIYFRGDDKIQVDSNDSGNRYYVITNALFRDVSAYYHILVHWNTTDGTASNRFKVYVNGVEQSIGGNSYPPQNYEGQVNRNVSHRVGACTDNSRYFDGYIAETYFIDGQALSPTDFGEYDEDSGIWKPIQYTGSYGTNGFYLDFENSGSLGADQSGNGNDFTATNLASTDQTTDTPTNNFATWNPVIATNSTMTLAEGNLNGTTGSNYASGASNSWFSTMGVSSGKWYAEFKLTSASDSYPDIACGVGVAYDLSEHQRGTAVTGGSSFMGLPEGFGYLAQGTYVNDDAQTSTGFDAYDVDDIIGVALDLDNSKIYWSKNGTWQNSANPDTPTGGISIDANEEYYFAISDKSLSNTHTYSANFGSPAFSISSGNSDENGYGNFEYAPPSGFLALCTQNLATELSPTIDDGSQYFNTVLYSGTGGTRTVTGVGFQPDWLWIKRRDSAENHFIVDSNRGAGIHLRSDATDAESDNSGTQPSFDSDGFSLTGTGGAVGQTNASGGTYVAWNWLANGGTTSSNTDGDITSTVQVNSTAGFSIVQFTKTGDDQAVGHGLGKKPKLIIIKPTNTTGNWIVMPEINGVMSNKYLLLNSDSSLGTDGSYEEPTSSVFYVSNQIAGNNTHIGYVFTDIEGYSKAFSYTGNGSTTDGTFAYLGFRPSMCIWKRTDSATDWRILDTTRSTYNVMRDRLFPNNTSAESDSDVVDFLSNGIKFRTGNAGDNASGGSYIGFAWAENPFVTSSGVPVVAR